jgi:hypothetical protein
VQRDVCAEAKRAFGDDARRRQQRNGAAKRVARDGELTRCATVRLAVASSVTSSPKLALSLLSLIITRIASVLGNRCHIHIASSPLIVADRASGAIRTHKPSAGRTILSLKINEM